MERVGRWIGVVVLAAVSTAGGCAFARKPYAGDPLLVHGHGVWGDQERARLFEDLPVEGPVAPLPPPGPLVGSPLLASDTSPTVTSP